MYVICLEYHYVGVLALVCFFAFFVLSLFRFRLFLHFSFINTFVVIVIIILFLFHFVMQNPDAFCHFAVSLGFIKDVPATSCREIIASEGASAVSGNYWLDSIKPGQVTLVSCDMRTGGEFLSGICGLRHSYLLLSRRR